MDNKESYPTIKDFVLQEANEKAFERMVMGLKDYEKEKAKILTERRDQLHLEFEKVGKESLAQRRIHKSALINGSRMKKMNSRHKNLEEVVKQSEDTLANTICKDLPRYKALLKQLIVEGLVKLLEPIVNVRCLSRDRQLIEGILAQCKSEFQELLRKAGIDEAVGEVQLQVDQKFELAEVTVGGTRVGKSEQNNRCFGGVILTNEDGLIVCKNTLDSRLELAYQQMLPKIRRELFSE